MNQIKYNVTCSSGGAPISTTSKSTPLNSDGNGNVIFLDRHNVDCGQNAFLSQFALDRGGTGNQIRYSYKCANTDKNLTCRNVSTPANSDGFGNIIYLDRHDVKCNNDEVLSGFHLTRPSTNQIQYNYKCCK